MTLPLEKRGWENPLKVVNSVPGIDCSVDTLHQYHGELKKNNCMILVEAVHTLAWRIDLCFDHYVFFLLMDVIDDLNID